MQKYNEYAEMVCNDEMTIPDAACKLHTTSGKFRNWMKENGYLDSNGNKITEELYTSNPCGICGEYFCEWLQKEEPVPGWVAEPVVRVYSDKEVNSFAIRSCPKFRKMEKGRRKR